MFELLQSEGNLVSIKLSGRLDNTDYLKFIQAIQDAGLKGQVHLLVQLDNSLMHDIHPSWDPVRVETRLASHIDKVALVGDPSFTKLLSALSKPFMTAQVQTFEPNQYADAQKWVQDGLQDYED